MAPGVPQGWGEETRMLPYAHPLQDFQAILRRTTQQFPNGLWFCDIKTLEEGAVEILQLREHLHGRRGHRGVALVLVAAAATAGACTGHAARPELPGRPSGQPRTDPELAWPPARESTGPQAPGFGAGLGAGPRPGATQEAGLGEGGGRAEPGLPGRRPPSSFLRAGPPGRERAGAGLLQQRALLPRLGSRREGGRGAAWDAGCDLSVSTPSAGLCLLFPTLITVVRGKFVEFEFGPTTHPLCDFRPVTYPLCASLPSANGDYESTYLTG